MNAKLISTLALATSFFAVGAFAETPAAAPAVVPASPSPAPVAVTPDQIIYAAQLPTVADLTHAAAVQGLAVNQIVQTASDITVTYRFANGQTRTISYQLLVAGNQSPVQPVVASAAPVVVVAPYTDAYCYGPYYYGPWYPPIAVRIGAGFGFRGHWR